MSRINPEGLPLIQVSRSHVSNENQPQSAIIELNHDRGYFMYEDEEYIEEDDDDENKKLKEYLFSNIEAGDSNKVGRTLDNGAPPNTSCFVSHITACHYAAFLGHEEILQRLIDSGASINKVDRAGRTPLDLALWNGKEKCVELLLKNLKKEQDDQIEDIDRTKNIYLLDNAVSTIQQIKDVWNWSTPLHLASARAHVECIQLLIDDGYDTNVLDIHGLSALDVCGEGYMHEDNSNIDFEKFKSSVKILVEKVKHREIPITQSTPLHKAVVLNSKSATKLLVDISAYRNSFDGSGETPLHLAVMLKKKSILQIFKATKDNDIDCKNRDSLTPLHLAIKCKWRKGIAILLDCNANILAANNVGDTALHFAAAMGAPCILKDILEKLPNKSIHIDEINNARETPLMKAIESGDEHRVKVLLSENASINVITMNEQYNPFHVAVLANRGKVLKLLLNENSLLPSDQQILNNKCSLKAGGMTPLHLAAHENKLDCIKILLDFNADLHDKTTNSMYTPLHLAAIRGHIKVIELIIARDIKLMDERDAEDWKPFHRSVHKGHRDCVTLFLKNGADLSEKIFYHGNKRSIMELLINCMPRAVNYLEKLFDSMITKNDCEINDENCEISINYSILMPEYEMKDDKKFDDQMDVVVALLNTGKRFNQRKLLIHPFIESFLYIKWMNGLRFLYGFLVFMYILFVLSLTALVYKIYSKNNTEDWHSNTLSFFIGYLIFQEVSLILILLFKSKIRSYFHRSIGLWNWLSITMNIIVLAIDHSVPDRDWPKIMTATTVLLAWLEITVLLSHFPECGYTFQMFSTVTLRALKVLALFGMEVIIGFALAFWIMFHGEPAFESFTDALVRTIVMTSEFDYADLFSTFEAKNYRLIVQFVFVLFIFFVPIVMMNLIMALIISDTSDLKKEGKIKRLASQVRLIEILESVMHFIYVVRKLYRGTNQGSLQLITKIYPGKPSWEAISLVSNNIEESLFDRVKPTKKDNSTS